MLLGAMGLARIVGTDASPSPDVLLVGDGLQVRWVDTQGVSTEMINHVSIGDLVPQKLPHGTMSSVEPPVKVKYTIPASLSLSSISAGRLGSDSGP